MKCVHTKHLYSSLSTVCLFRIPYKLFHSDIHNEYLLYGNIRYKISSKNTFIEYSSKWTCFDISCVHILPSNSDNNTNKKTVVNISKVARNEARKKRRFKINTETNIVNNELNISLICTTCLCVCVCHD